MTSISPRQQPDDKDRLIQELRDAVAARDEFLVIAAHELRNPLTPVVLRLNSTLRLAQQRGDVPEPVVTRLEQLRDLIQNYLGRLNSLLDVSRIASGNLQLDVSDVDLTALARQVVAAMEPLARHAGSPLISNIESGLRGRWDRLAVEEVLQNLISNAVKYGEGKPVTLAIAMHKKSVQISVHDQGIGISQQDQQRIFRRFERAVAETRQGGGFGVGLWIVSRLVEAMGGNVSIESAPGAGATFTVVLPIESAQREEANHDQ